MPAFRSYKDFRRHLDGLGQFRMDLSRERIARVLESLAARLPAKDGGCAVQIVGTNGKGSTAVFLESLAREHGLATGLTTSPHFLSPRERILVSGRMLPEGEWTGLANEVMDAGGRELTYFELITALAALAFRRSGVDLAVLETGLGGQYDATTVLDAGLVLFTPIGLDHCHVLGADLVSIALDKSRAMRPGGAAITGPQEPMALEALRQTASERSAALHATNALATLPDVRLGLAGKHQQANAGLALAGYRWLHEHRGLPWDDQAVARGLARAWLPGRLQSVSAAPGVHPELILDGAHNPPAMANLRRTLAELNIQPASLVFTCMADKDLGSMAANVLALTRGPILVPELPELSRSQPAADVIKILGPRATAISGLAEALRDAQSPALVCGSLFLLGEFFKLRPQALCGPNQQPKSRPGEAQ